MTVRARLRSAVLVLTSCCHRCCRQLLPRPGVCDDTTVADPAVTTAITTIAVGVLTGVAALTGQWLTQRTTVRQAEVARRVALRIERKDAYLEFLEIVQEVSHVIEQRRSADPFDHGQAIMRTHRMWLSTEEDRPACRSRRRYCCHPPGPQVQRCRVGRPRRGYRPVGVHGRCRAALPQRHKKRPATVLNLDRRYQTLKRNLDRLARDLGRPGRRAAYARSWAHVVDGWLPTFDAVLCPMCAPEDSLTPRQRSRLVDRRRQGH